MRTNLGEAEAVRLMRRAVAIFERMLGPNHPNTQTVRHNLATMDARARAAVAAVNEEGNE